MAQINGLSVATRSQMLADLLPTDCALMRAAVTGVCGTRDTTRINADDGGILCILGCCDFRCLGDGLFPISTDIAFVYTSTVNGV